MSLKVLILGVNGFIGHRLAEKILAETNWNISGIDLSSDKLKNCLDHPRFYFNEGDIKIQRDWVESQIAQTDVVLPLVAIATPATYVQDPLRIFELDFEENLKIIRLCQHYKKRIVFPSTSEVYGMCSDEAFDEETSNLVLGPIHKERWIYSCSKQMLDRVIYAYGKHQDLQFSLFRPFNWIGPNLDNIYNTKPGGSRVVTQFLSNIIHGKDITLVNGGNQKRCFTDLDDGIDCLIKIIENKNNCAASRVFNIGNPYNNLSIKELAENLLELTMQYPNYAKSASQCRLITVDGEEYYGKGYQDTQLRVPAIENAKNYLDWAPKLTTQQSLKKITDFYLGPSRQIFVNSE